MIQMPQIYLKKKKILKYKVGLYCGHMMAPPWLMSSISCLLSASKWGAYIAYVVILSLLL